MNRDAFERIESLFHTARELPPAERPRFLDLECREDPELRRQVEAFLECEEEDTDFLETPALRATTFIADETTDLDVDRLIGPYRLVRLLGQGGMGSVYLAEREDDEYRSRVAIKVVKRGMDSDQISRRFRAERQTLADLEHRGIARLLDGGTIEDGRPYLVMELIEGLRIDRYCDTHRLDIAARIRLFREVCAAVQHAHRNLVVHCDIKPSNILVDEQGQPKLLDFGIAKILEPRTATACPQTTVAGSRLMTLDYASPEQVRGGAMTTSTDVYSLAVLLYELLSGHHPYRNGSDRPSTELSVLEEEPRKPSAAVGLVVEFTRADGTTERITPESVSHTRDSSVDGLRRRLGGDLDNIILMGLRKEPERRYASVNQLSLDLDRYLNGRPVLARRDTIAYRTAKFVRRNLLGVVAALIVLASMIAGIVGTRSQARHARLERDAAQQARTEAEEVTRFLVDLFEVSDPRGGRAADARALDLLDRGAERIEDQLRERPAVMAALMESIGSIYRNLGAYSRAGPILERALAVRRGEFGDESLAVAASLENLGELRRIEGRPGDAIAHLSRALEIRERLSGRADPGAIASRNALAAAQRLAGNFDMAESMLREALAIQRAEPSDRPELLAATLNNLSVVAISAGRYDDAEALALEAILAVSELPPDHPDSIAGLSSLAVAQERQGRFMEARATFARVLEFYETSHGTDHPDTAVAKSHLGIVLRRLGEAERAETLLRDAVETLRNVATVDLPYLNVARNNLAEMLFSKGDLEGAEGLYRESLESLENRFGKEHDDYAGTLNNLGFILESRQDYRAAAVLYEQVLSIDRRRVGDDHPNLATTLTNLARTHHARGDFAEAEPLYREALAILQHSFGQEHKNTAHGRVQLGLLLADMRQFEEAEELVLGAYESLLALEDRPAAQIAAVRESLAYVYSRSGQPEKAERYRNAPPTGD